MFFGIGIGLKRIEVRKPIPFGPFISLGQYVMYWPHIQIREESKMNVYMDDQRSCPFGYVPATTVECALQMVQDYDVNILSLDFNMGWGAKNGLDFVEAFCTEGYM